MAETNVRKCLERILAAERMSSKKNLIARIVENCNGDIRSAINSLQLAVRSSGSAAYGGNFDDDSLTTVDSMVVIRTMSYRMQ